MIRPAPWWWATRPGSRTLLLMWTTAPMTCRAGMAAAIVPPGSTLSSCCPWHGPPNPSKNHHGTPFIAVSTIVSGPSSGPITAAADRAPCALTASTTRSCGPSSAGSAAARTGAVTSSPPVSSRQPWVRRASSVAPRARAETSVPAAASRVPMKPPIAPAPSTHPRIGVPSVRRPPSVLGHLDLSRRYVEHLLRERLLLHGQGQQQSHGHERHGPAEQHRERTGQGGAGGRGPELGGEDGPEDRRPERPAQGLEE